jgi:2,5-diamino-6-(ribosylamino)-4(3H)-pyrimidinone 5'-phosphate reductase
MKPYMICYMMTSVDRKIDCGMTAQLKGVDEYYQGLVPKIFI